jgi:hypothetical protein
MPTPTRRVRHDGWTPERCRAFLKTLGDCGSPRVAAARVGMHHSSAYRLRERPGMERFRAAWDKAVAMKLTELGECALSRAIEGELVPLYNGSKIVGMRRRHDTRLMIFMLNVHDRRIAAAQMRLNEVDSAPAPKRRRLRRVPEGGVSR